MMCSDNQHIDAGHSHTPKWLCLTLVVITLALQACVYSERSEYYSINPEGWIYGDTLKFQPCDSDTTALHRGDLAIAVRHNNNYAYSNLWLRVEYQSSDSLRADTVNLILSDEFGNWYGKGIGVSYQLIDTVLTSVVIDVNRPIKINHIMRTDTLCNIEQLGVVFTEKSPRK